MRIGIISDVHSNWEALQAVLAHLEGKDVDELWCLGDAVGYGANPRECLSLLRQRCRVLLKGNHDEAAATLWHLEWFNDWARAAALWTHQQLTEEERLYLHGLPASQVVSLPSSSLPAVWLVHGSLREPLTEYILNAEIALANIHALQQEAQERLGQTTAPLVLFFGHSHVAEAYFMLPNKRRLQHRRFLVNTTLSLEPDGIYLVNIGSVGQPRDGTPHAACAVLDTETLTVEVFRLPYDVQTAAQKILQAGLPQELAWRLFQGW